MQILASFAKAINQDPAPDSRPNERPMNEEQTRVVLSCQELYEKLWTVPAASLSKTFGISDVGLANVCRKHRVPQPPRGNWAKLRNGKRVDKMPLPAMNDTPESIVLHTSTQQQGSGSWLPVFPHRVAGYCVRIIWSDLTDSTR